MSDTKEFKKFDKTLNNILYSSAGASSWSDLLSFTKEITKHLEDKKEKLNFGLISDKNSLSKRLAQCLNPECPAGVHEAVISIYDMIFQNILSKNNTLIYFFNKRKDLIILIKSKKIIFILLKLNMR